MQSYPTYLPNQMNTNMNPTMGMYQGYNPSIQNPYMDRMNQLQQYQQGLQMSPTQMSGTSQQVQGLVGKMVNDVSMVSPNDVPMDGNVAIFPKNDMSEIYCKQWKQDGTIQTVVYKPILEQNPQEGTNIPQMDFNALNEDVRALREDIKNMRGLIEKSMGGTASKTSARGKKAEANENE